MTNGVNFLSLRLFRLKVRLYLFFCSLFLFPFPPRLGTAADSFWSIDEDEDDGGNLEPISSENIISGGRRTRGKTIDFQEAAEKLKADEMSDDDDDDEDFVANDDNDDGNKMRD